MLRDGTAWRHSPALLLNLFLLPPKFASFAPILSREMKRAICNACHAPSAFDINLVVAEQNESLLFFFFFCTCSCKDQYWAWHGLSSTFLLLYQPFDFFLSFTLLSFLSVFHLSGWIEFLFLSFRRGGCYCFFFILLYFIIIFFQDFVGDDPQRAIRHSIVSSLPHFHSW